MKLSFEDIKSVAVGAVSVKQMDNGVHFYKATDRQIAAWYALSDVLGQRAETTTGIRLDFHTNSKKLRFAVSSGGKFDVYINGLLRKQFVTDKEKCAELDICGPYGESLDDARVTLIFPSHSIGVLSKLELDDGAYVRRHEFDTKILFFGDSITQGYASSYDSLSYAWHVTNHFNAESIIHGVGGGYYHETLFDTIDFEPDTVIVSLGTNDWGHHKTLADLKHHCASFLDSIVKEYKGKAKNIFVISPIWRGDTEANVRSMGSFAQCRAVIIEEALRRELTHIDGLTLVPPDPALFLEDTLHPVDQGFAFYANNLIREMKKYM